MEALQRTYTGMRSPIKVVLMSKKGLSSVEGYNPDGLIDRLIEELRCKNDAGLCRKLYLPPPVISKLRRNRLPMSDTILVRMYDCTGISIDTLREWCGIPKFNPEDVK